MRCKEKTMPVRHFRGLLVCSVVLVMMLLTACAGTVKSRTGTTGTTPATQVPTAATQPPTAAPSPVAFKAGGISFIGPVKSITSSSLVMSAPNGQTYTLAITAQTDRSAFGGSLPAVGALVVMDSTFNAVGSLSASPFKPGPTTD